MLLVVLAIVAMGYYRFYQQKKTIYPLLLMYSIMLFFFNSFVTFDFAIRQATNAITALQTLFQKDILVGQPTLMQPHGYGLRELALTYYATIGVVSLIGGLRFLREKRENRKSMPLVFFFFFAFVVSIIIRASISADPWSWTYYMSLRGTIWAFMGISILLIIGFRYVLKTNSHIHWKGGFVLLLIICVLAAGKFSQNPLWISDSSRPLNVTYSRYRASLWLRAEAQHGSNLLVAPYSSDVIAFAASREMSPYAYLTEFFLDEKPYSKFSGYIPIIGGYFDRYEDSPDVNIIYGNGEARIGFKAR